MPPPKLLYPSRQVTWLLILFALATLYYFTWRPTAVNQNAIWLSTLLLIAELYGVVMGAIHVWMTWRLTERDPGAPLKGVTVDIFIPTYNESVDTVRRTVAAAVAMELPHTTWLLDDGNRPAMAELAEQLGAKYLARTDRSHAKAGNLNHALAHATGDFVAIFDADHVPNKTFLKRTLGYFRDPEVAFVQTPQDFYNTDSFQHRERTKEGLVWTEQSLFFRVIQRGKDYWNAAFFCGSCAITRRSALDGIGGFATGTITEDLHTSIKLHKAGWKSIYHHESLAFGIAPATIEPFISQRIRWGQGAMQVWRQEGLLFAKGLTWPQRLNYFASVSTYFDGWQKGILYFLPVYSLWTGQMPLNTSVPELLIHWLPFIILNYVLFEEIARGYGRSIYVEQYNLARFYAFAWATLTLIWNRPLKFKVTNKERDGKTLAPASWPPRIVYWLNISAIPVGIILFLSFHHLGLEALILASAWSLFNTVLASSVVRFTGTKNRFLRKNHRFNVPHVIELHRAGERKICIVDNISTDGCRIYGQVPDDLGEDELVKARLHLPHLKLVAPVRIRNRFYSQGGGQSYLSAVGCTFEWENPSDELALEKYLYGSDHQWSLNGVTEQDLTPMAKFAHWVARRPYHVHQESRDWHPLLDEFGEILGVISPRQNPKTGCIQTISNDPPREVIKGARSIGRRQSQTLDLQLIRYHRIDTPAHPYYLCDYARARS